MVSAFLLVVGMMKLPAVRRRHGSCKTATCRQHARVLSRSDRGGGRLLSRPSRGSVSMKMAADPRDKRDNPARHSRYRRDQTAPSSVSMLQEPKERLDAP